MHMSSAGVKQGDALSSHFSSYTVTSIFPVAYVMPHFLQFFFALLSILWMFLSFKLVPKTHAEVLSTLPKSKKAMMCLMEKLRVR